MPDRLRSIIVSASSDIGGAMARRRRQAGWAVSGTYRGESADTAELRRLGVDLVHCDLEKAETVDVAAARLADSGPWDELVLGAGTTEPIGPFEDCDFDAWASSITVNFTNQMRFVRRMLASRRRGARSPLVLFFAGGGTNNATLNYSAYTLAKIALIKACELLDAEIPDARFAILGPGWVETKIHRETLEAGSLAGANLERTRDKLARRDFTPMKDVLDCCDWLLDGARDVVSGRNFSVVHDSWREPDLARRLAADPDLYKLRRFGNSDAGVASSPAGTSAPPPKTPQ